MEGWQKLLLAAGGAAGVAAVVYFLLKEDEPDARELTPGQGKKPSVAVEEITKEQVRHILGEIIGAQEQMKGYLKELTQEMIKTKMTFEEAYTKVKDVQPDDALEKHGLSMQDFDQLIEKYQSCPHIQEAITKIMGAPSPSSAPAGIRQSVSVDKIIEVHEFMLEQLQKLSNDFQALPNKASYDQKTVVITAQAIVGSTIEQKFELTSEDIESAVHEHHTELLGHQKFASININIQHTMTKLIGNPGM